MNSHHQGDIAIDLERLVPKKRGEEDEPPLDPTRGGMVGHKKNAITKKKGKHNEVQKNRKEYPSPSNA